MSLPTQNPLGYMGIKEKDPPELIKARRAPTTADFRYDLGDMWIDETTAACYQLAAKTAGVATWVTLGGASADVNTISGDAGGNRPPTLGNIQIAGGRNIVTSGAASVITVDIDTGTAAARQNEFSATGNELEVYANDTGVVAGTTVRAFRGDLLLAGGNGTESPQAVRGNIATSAGSNLAEIYSGFFSGTQANGSVIVSNAIACLGITTINEVNPADQPQQWIAGSQSIVAFDAAAGVPTAAIVCGALSHIMYDPAMNGLAHGYVASRNGGGAGNTAGAAYKVVAGGGIADWNYGVDLVTGGAGAAALYGLGDIRLANGLTIDSINATDTDITCPANGRFDIQLGDAAGVEEFSIRSSGPAVVAKINSLGEYVGTNVECGTNALRRTEYTTNISLVQAFANDNTASGASVRTAIYGNMMPTAGDGNGTPNGIYGVLDNTAGANILQGSGVLGYFEQENGSVVASTATGVEGWLNLLEVNAADLPATYAFAVKGYLDSTDGAGVPGGIVAGVGSVVEYNTPFNSKAYGMAVTRLNTGVGAGTAGQAAYGVVQGPAAFDDWLYGVDLYTGSTTNNYSTGDIRLAQQNLIKSVSGAPTGATAAGTLAIRSNAGTSADVLWVNRDGVATSWEPVVKNTATTTWIEQFNESPIIMAASEDGATVTAADTGLNTLIFQGGEIMEVYNIGNQGGTSRPIMVANGLKVSRAEINAQGSEYNWSTLALSKHIYTVGTSPAIYFKVRFRVADVTGASPVLMGFRKVAANNSVYTNYTDYAAIGLNNGVNPATIIIEDRLNGGAAVQTNTTDAWVDAGTHTLTVYVSGTGVTTYTIDGAAPTVTHAFTFDNGDLIMPFFHILFGAAAPGEICWLSMFAGPQ